MNQFSKGKQQTLPIPDETELLEVMERLRTKLAERRSRRVLLIQSLHC